MSQNVLVISDLHLGGLDGFEICSPDGQGKLAAFFAWLAHRTAAGPEIHLVINGDILDFLAERNPAGEFDAFVADENTADWKLAAILDRTDAVWGALAHLVSVGARLTLLIGNHDIELSLPAPRRRLLERLGPGRVDFLYDNQALKIGGALVEHGNRYDPWNAVDHDGLRQVRSSLSRGRPPPAYDPPPGSRLVTMVINGLKQRYRFVDLLKPETASVLPLLAALRAPRWRDVANAVRMGARAFWRRTDFDERGEPVQDGLISGGGPAPPTPREVAERSADEDACQMAERLDQESQADDDGSGLIAAGPTEPDATRLLRALRFLWKRESRTFDTGFESPSYLRPATDLAALGHQVVVFGHTHLAKSVPLAGGARYLNSGTWADLMCLPAAVIDGPDEPAAQALAGFLDDLRENRLDRIRRQVATYASISLDDGGSVRAAEVRLFSSSAPDAPLSTPELLRGLAVS